MRWPMRMSRRRGCVATGPASRRRHKLLRFLQLAGCVCLLVVVLTHVAEALHLLPSMGWGLPNSPGHYLDLFSAVSGVVLLLAAYVVRRRISN